VASTVSNLTSRIGTIGGTIVGGGSSLAKNVGGYNSISAASNVGMGQPPPFSPNRQQRAGQGDSLTNSQRQTTPPPGPRRQSHPAIKETYAPPMSQLFSFEQEEPNNDGPDDNDGGYIDADYDAIVGPHSMDDDANTTDDEEENPDIATPRWQSVPKRSSHPFLNDPPQLELPPSGSISMPPPHPTARSSLPPSSSVPSRPRIGHSTTSSSVNTDGRRTESRRMYRDYDDDDDDDDGSSLGRKIKSALGACIPRAPRLFRRNSGIYDDGSWSDDESKESRRPRTKDHHSTSLLSAHSSPVVPRPVQSLLEKRETLLSLASARSCASIGRTQAALDACQLALIVSMLREAVPQFFQALSFSGDIRRAIVSTLLTSSLDGWAPYALAAIFLLSASDRVWIQPALRAAYADAAFENTSDAAYTQLYLRLMTSMSMSKSMFLSDLIKEATWAQALQVASSARLRFFVTLAALYVLLSTVAVLRPAVISVASAMADVMYLDVWRDSPIDWKNLSGGMQNIGSSLALSLGGLIGTEIEAIRQQPLRVAMVVSLLTSLVVVSYLPSLEKRRKSGPSPTKSVIGDIYGEENEDEDASIASLWSSIGSSSATRLRLLSSPRGVEGALEQFAKLCPDRAVAAGIGPVRQPTRLPRRKNKRSRRKENSQLLTKVLYSTSSLIVLSAPLAIYLYFFAPIFSSDRTNWVSLLELASLLAFTHLRAANAMNGAIQFNSIRLGQNSLNSFFQRLEETVAELRKLASESSSGADFQAMLTASPTKGINVSDLWAAHSARRAWAIKGANIHCRNGEVCIIIGADGAGKTRLLTAIAEHLFAPPKSARTTTYVRGSFNLAGVDISKWDRNQLKKRVGVLLNDVRTVSDYASLMAGCTLEEILEPVLEGGRAGPKERNSMSVAMKVSLRLSAAVLTWL
jgi:ABC-type multidrug transport system fused ATPase/permease subunit